VEFKSDGTGSLAVDALWDSSVHSSLFLNRVTAPNQRVLLQVTWSVDIDTCADPAQFTMDMAVTMQARDARPPSKLMAMLGSSKILSKTSTVFSLKLSPPLTRSPKDLWRLDTSEKYIRGEESLGSWKPRGISVVEDYVRLDTMERRAADVQAVRVILGAATSTPPGPWSTPRDPDALLRKALGLWQKKFGHRGNVS
jgi:kinesin family protein 1